MQTMCRFSGVSRSGYYDYIKHMDKPDRDETLAVEAARYRPPVRGYPQGHGHGKDSRNPGAAVQPPVGNLWALLLGPHPQQRGGLRGGAGFWKRGFHPYPVGGGELRLGHRLQRRLPRLGDGGALRGQSHSGGES